MLKYSKKEKLEAVLRVVDQGMTTVESGKILGASPSQIQGWVARYQGFGLEGLIMKQGSYNGNFKLSVIKYMHDNHCSLNHTAAKFGIPSDVTVGIWERIYYEEGPEGLFKERRGRPKKMKENNPKKPKLKKEIEEDLIAEVQRLRMGNAYLKKLNALVQERIQRENGKK